MSLQDKLKKKVFLGNKLSRENTMCLFSPIIHNTKLNFITCLKGENHEKAYVMGLPNKALWNFAIQISCGTKR